MSSGRIILPGWWSPVGDLERYFVFDAWDVDHVEGVTQGFLFKVP